MNLLMGGAGFLGRVSIDCSVVVGELVEVLLLSLNVRDGRLFRRSIMKEVMLDLDMAMMRDDQDQRIVSEK